jgi:hypothetical protein
LGQFLERAVSNYIKQVPSQRNLSFDNTLEGGTVLYVNYSSTLPDTIPIAVVADSSATKISLEIVWPNGERYTINKSSSPLVIYYEARLGKFQIIDKYSKVIYKELNAYNCMGNHLFIAKAEYSDLTTRTLACSVALKSSPFEVQEHFVYDASEFNLGLCDATTSAIHGIWDIIKTLTSPVEFYDTLTFLNNAFTPGTEEHYLVKDALSTTAKNAWQDFSGIDPRKRSRIIGRLTGEILVAIISAKGIDKATKVLRVSSETGYLNKLLKRYSKGEITPEAIVVSLEAAADAIPLAMDAATLFRTKVINGLFKQLDGITNWETSTISAMVDKANPSIIGKAGACIFEYNPSIWNNMIQKSNKLEYINYYKRLLMDAGIDEFIAANASRFAGKDIKSIKIEMAKLRTAIQNAKNMAEDFAKAHPDVNMLAMDGSYSFQWWPVENCAEIWAAWDAILNGAKFNNLVARSIDFEIGAFKDFCQNCTNTFANAIKVTG